MSIRYAKSELQLERARDTIPLGAQTFSKSITQFPYGTSPYFAARARGSRIWDVDGHEYIDFTNALAAVTLGYCDPDVDRAVAKQLEDGTIYSLSHALEAEVAELICACVPSAEMVRFGKNGSDATAGAVRVARAYTGRDHVLTCGYHGWQDWFIGSTSRDKGVPQATRDLVHPFIYNDLQSLRSRLSEFDGKVAAVIMEPMNVAEPAPGFLESVKTMTHEAGAVLIFDETITGFRLANGGAQEKFNVIPDLTTLGKGLANGFPLSAVCGRRELMMEMEEIFFSFTMGGETLSLAAAKAVIEKMQREPVVKTMRENGSLLSAGVAERLKRHGVSEFLSISGDPTWSFLTFKDFEAIESFEIKTLFLQEIFARGVLSLGTHNMSYAHTRQDVESLLAVYDEVFPILSNAAKNGALRQYLKAEPLKPLFKVR
jgi:glutamate-1-semialdehyde 2,1-aminomutase